MWAVVFCPRVHSLLFVISYEKQKYSCSSLRIAHSQLFFFVTERCVYVCLTVGVSGSTAARAKCNLHATRQWLVGGYKWHSEEHLPHTAAGCSLLHTTPHPCHSWDQLPAAPRRGDASFSFEPALLCFSLDCHFIRDWDTGMFAEEYIRECCYTGCPKILDP